MSYAKRRLAVFLCMLMAFTTVFCFAPQQTVQAATTYFYWEIGAGNATDSNRQVTVEKGAKNFYIGDYLGASVSGGLEYYGALSMCSGVTYKSTKPGVVKIDSKTGKITARKTGIATIKVKFKGASTQIKIKVVDSLKSKRSTNYSVEKKAADAFIKAYGKGITSKNRYKVLNAYKDFSKMGYISSHAIAQEKGEIVYYLYLPEAGHAKVLVSEVVSYAIKRNPFGTDHSKEFCITALSGKGKTITATLSQKVTADQIFGAQYADIKLKKASSKNSVTFPVYVQDTKTNTKYDAEATMKKGSKTLTIKPKNLSLKKNRTYEIVAYGEYFGEYSSNWLFNSKVTKFKAK